MQFVFFSNLRFLLAFHLLPRLLKPSPRRLHQPQVSTPLACIICSDTAVLPSLPPPAPAGAAGGAASGAAGWIPAAAALAGQFREWAGAVSWAGGAASGRLQREQLLLSQQQRPLRELGLAEALAAPPLAPLRRALAGLLVVSSPSSLPSCLYFFSPSLAFAPLHSKKVRKHCYLA